MKSQERVPSPNGRYYVLIHKKEPLLSFGSGKKELRLYTSYYLFLGKCVFGEFPLKIIEWDLKNNIILIEISEYRIENMPYINQYTNLNKRLGNFDLQYKIQTKKY
jgi:hypothetical protein